MKKPSGDAVIAGDLFHEGLGQALAPFRLSRDYKPGAGKRSHVTRDRLHPFGHECFRPGPRRVVAEEPRHDLQESRLAVGSGSPQDEEAPLADVAGEAVADDPLHELDQRGSGCEDAAHEGHEPRALGVGVVVHGGDFTEQILGPVRMGFELAQVVGAIRKIQVVPVGVELRLEDGDARFRCGEIQHGSPPRFGL